MFWNPCEYIYREKLTIRLFSQYCSIYNSKNSNIKEINYNNLNKIKYWNFLFIVILCSVYCTNNSDLVPAQNDCYALISIVQ
jgi:hypothetical protein